MEKKRIFLVKFLLVGILFGNKLQIDGLRILGVVPTFYRISVIISILISIPYFFKNYKQILKRLNFISLFVLIWFIYSFLRFNMGYLESFINHFLGFVSFILIVGLVENKDEIKEVIRFIAGITFVFIVIGCFELITGIHFGESRFNDKVFKFLACGQFHNENDFSAFLAVMLPIIYLSDYKMFMKNIFVAFAIIIILYNKSILVTLSIFLVILIYLLIKLYQYIHIKRKKIVFTSFLSTIFLVSYFNFNNIIENTTFYWRSIMYSYGIKNCMNHFLFGGGIGRYNVGMKEVGFPGHLLKFGSSDPHCLILEIWGQYGFLVIFPFMCILGISLLEKIIKYCKNKNIEDFIMMSLIIIYLISSLSSSTGIEKNYTWIGLIIITWYNSIDFHKLSQLIKEKKCERKN